MPWIIGGAVLGSAALGFAGQQSANRANMANAQGANLLNIMMQGSEFQFSHDEARLQREWQQNQAQAAMGFSAEQSATAYQRAVRDMQAAGLNPMLAYSQGGASTPTGQMGQGSTATAGTHHAVQPPPMQNVWASAAASASQAASIAQQAEQIKVIQAQKGLVESQTTQNLASAGQLDATRDSIRQEMQNFDDRWRKLKSEANLKAYESATEYGRMHFYLGAKDIEPKFEQRFQAELDAARAHASELQNRARLLQLEIPKGVAEASFYSGPAGTAAPYLRFGLDAVTGAARARYGLGLKP